LAGPASSDASLERPLVALAVAGDKLAFGDLVRRHGSAVRMLLRRMGAQPAVADDIAQDAFIAAWRQIASLRADTAFEPWVKRIAARLYIKHWRRAGRYGALEEGCDEVSHLPNPGGAMDLDAALRSLPEAERLCISLAIGAGYTHEEAALALRLPLGTVKSHIRRGLERLKTRLATEGQVA
jgi:RNA polymerase sigma factor (sigma-70 family)